MAGKNRHAVRSSGRSAGARAPIAVDVAIVGGGMVGLSLAAALAGVGIDVMVIDSDKPAKQVEAAFDGRTSAIAYASARALAGIGLWTEIEAVAQPILDIRVSDGASGLFLHYDHSEIGEAPLGYIVENRDIRRGLQALAGRLDRLMVRAPARVASVERAAAGVRLVLDDGQRIAASLVVGADGRRSQMREMAGIRATEWRYRQVGIVCTVEHERPHHGVAHERFLPAGPFAVLPMIGNRSSLVWTERAELGDTMMALNDAEFAGEIARRFDCDYGKMTPVGGRWAYPLGLLHAERYVDRRLALVGDAAHGVHPISGQGLNLGLRDVAALAEALVDAHRLGLDVGAADALARYQRWRRFDTMTVLAVTDGLNRLFSNDLAPVRWARDLGLAAVNRMPALKRTLMHHAMGSVGDLPRLLAGDAL